MLLTLALPIVLSAIALFFASFLSWMVLQLHKKDWVKLEKDDEFLKAAGKCDIPLGNYMFPGANSPRKRKLRRSRRNTTPGRAA